jgi:hypothetical protein
MKTLLSLLLCSFTLVACLDSSDRLPPPNNATPIEVDAGCRGDEGGAGGEGGSAQEECGPFEFYGGVRPSEDPADYSLSDLETPPLVVGGVPTVCGGGCSVIDTEAVAPFCELGDSAWVDTIVCAVEGPEFSLTGMDAKLGVECAPLSGSIPEHVWCCRHE